MSSLGASRIRQSTGSLSSHRGNRTSTSKVRGSAQLSSTSSRSSKGSSGRISTSTRASHTAQRAKEPRKPTQQDQDLAEMEEAIGRSMAALTPSPLTKVSISPSTDFEFDRITPTLNMRMSLEVANELNHQTQSPTAQSSPQSSVDQLLSSRHDGDTEDESGLTSPAPKSPRKPVWALDESRDMRVPSSPGWEVIPVHRRDPQEAWPEQSIQSSLEAAVQRQGELSCVTHLAPSVKCSSPVPRSPARSLSTNVQKELLQSPSTVKSPLYAHSSSSVVRAKGELARDVSVAVQSTSTDQVLSRHHIPAPELSDPPSHAPSCKPTVDNSMLASSNWQNSSLRLSTDRLDSIFSFLDAADQTSETLGIDATVPSVEKRPQEDARESDSVEGYQYGARMGQMYGGVKSKMDGMKAEISQQAATIDSLQLELSKKEEGWNAERKKMIDQHEKHLGDVRSELEGAVGRNLEFIDRLLADKEELNVKCEELTNQLTQVKQRWVLKMTQFEEECKRNIEQAKAQRDATEQLRRNKWQAQKEKEIKEITIKGLEPEVERMLAKHKADLAEAITVKHIRGLARHGSARVKFNFLFQSHEDAVRRVREELNSAHEDAMRRERTKHRDEVDASIERERSIATEQQRQLGMRHEAEMAAQRQRLMDGFQGDTESKESSWRERARAQDETIASLRRELDEAKEMGKRELRRELAERDELHAHELQQLQHQHKLQRAEYKHTMKDELTAEFELAMRQRAEETSKQLAEERDEEIEMVIQRLESENRASVEAEKKRHEEKLSHTERALNEATSREQEWKDKYRDEVAVRAGLEDSISTLETRLSSANASQDESMSKQQQLSNELHSVRVEMHTKERAAEDAARKLRSAHECEVIALKKSMLEIESRMQLMQRQHNEVMFCTVLQAELWGMQALGEMNKANADELERVNTRVRQAIEKKDGVIMRLREQLTATERQAVQLEALLDPNT